MPTLPFQALDIPLAPFLTKFLMGFCLNGPCKCTWNLKFAALAAPEIIGGTPGNLGSPLIRLCFFFWQIFNRCLFGCILRMYRPNLQSVALAEIIAIAVFVWGCELPILGKGRLYGSAMVPFESALVTSWVQVKTVAVKTVPVKRVR